MLEFPLTFSYVWLFTWLGAALTAVGYGLATRSTVRRAAGMGLMTVPLWLTLIAIINSIPVLASGDSVVRAIPKDRLTLRFARPILIDIGYLVTGYLLWNGVPSSVREWARNLRDQGLPMGNEARSARIGFATFPLLLIGTVVVDIVLRNQLPSLVNGDESMVWSNMTAYHTIMLSAAAAFTEELQYRVLLYLILVAGFAKLMPRRYAVGSAVALQALIFGFAHAGYGTWIHVILPTLFGLVAGIAAVRYGLWSAIVLHFFVDFYVFGSYAIAHDVVFQAFVFLLLFANIAWSLTAGGFWLYGWRKRTRLPMQ